MSIPLRYNLRNLVVRRSTTLMTALGIGLTVAVLSATLALLDGLRVAFEASGRPQNVLLLRKGSTSELSSAMNEETYRDILFKSGIAHAPGSDQPLVSLELITTVTLPKSGDARGQSVSLRGLLPVGLTLRPLQLREGRWFRTGQRELVVGEFVSRRCPAAHLGGSLRIGNSDWSVVGVMSAGNSASSSEIFSDLNQASSFFNRKDQFNSVLVAAADASLVPQLINTFNNDQRLNVTAQTESSYYEHQTASAAPIRDLGILVALIMSIGSSFAAMNTMYAAVARRAHEIGTLRVLGFSQGRILLSFLIESLLLSGLGGVLGCLLVLPLAAATTAIGNFTTMSETICHFRLGPVVLLGGMGFAIMIGGLGGLLPAKAAARKPIVTALREK
jgi:putative ABC transport system permease protein